MLLKIPQCSATKLAHPCLYLVLWQPAATLSLCWQCQRPRRHHQSSGQVKTELASRLWTAISTQLPMLLWTAQQGYYRTTLGWQDIKSLCSKLDFVEKVYQKLASVFPVERYIIRDPEATEQLKHWHFIAARITWEDHNSLCSSSYLENCGHTRHQYNFHGYKARNLFFVKECLQMIVK